MGDIFSYTAFSPETMSLQDQIHVIIGNAISDIASRGRCVIVGRCADYILRGREDCMNVFIHSPKGRKLRRVVDEYGICEKNAEKEMEKIDRSRAGYYKYYSGQTWGLAKNYDVSLNSGLFSLETCAQAIVSLAGGS
jgi:cytidylate kinase